MSKANHNDRDDDLLPEYDFASMGGGVRGKYYQRYRAGVNLVLLDPDMAKAFPTAAAVNDALRTVMRATPMPKRRTRPRNNRMQRMTPAQAKKPRRRCGCWADLKGRDGRQLAEASDHVTVEVHQLGTPSEPPFFTRCRTRVAEALQAALPKSQVRVQYPYPRERSAETIHTEPPR
jgi:hypothetical protein